MRSFGIVLQTWKGTHCVSAMVTVRRGALEGAGLSLIGFDDSWCSPSDNKGFPLVMGVVKVGESLLGFT